MYTRVDFCKRLCGVSVIRSKGVPESHIIFLNVIAAPQGIQGLCKKHPMVKIMTSEINASLTEDSRVIPGLGEFADHYFGTDNSKKYQEYPGMPITSFHFSDLKTVA
ncbi:unnamed protein product [Brassica oleracea var. botrytis]|uniref:(rape) hypothetical protein n=1 Tax=Brassica napus TaxID=3708 RepID=A0A816K4D1_BRANA|nr:unnamed protein product [Brassica napus]